jgi:hypothetical protein
MNFEIQITNTNLQIKITIQNFEILHLKGF